MPGQPAACAPVDSEALYGLYQHCRIPREHLYTQRRGPNRLSTASGIAARCKRVYDTILHPAAEKIRYSLYNILIEFYIQEVISGVLSTSDTCAFTLYCSFYTRSPSKNHQTAP